MMWFARAMDEWTEVKIIEQKVPSIRKSALSLMERLEARLKRGKEGEFEEEVDIAAIDCPWSLRKEREK